MNEGWRIGEVAERAGVKASLIRYYESIGLLSEPGRISGHRRYEPSVLRRLSVIDVAQRAGMTLDEIRVLLEHGREPVAEQLRELASAKLADIRALIASAKRVEAWLETATTCGCQAIDDCSLFDNPEPSSRRTPFSLPISRMGT